MLEIEGGAAAAQHPGSLSRPALGGPPPAVFRIVRCRESGSQLGCPAGRMDSMGSGGKGHGKLHLFSLVSLFCSGGSYPGLCAQRTGEVGDLLMLRERPGAVSLCLIVGGVSTYPFGVKNCKRGSYQSIGPL
jgi:hypothetical protein